MTKSITKANQSQLVDAVSKILCVKVKADTWEDFAETVDETCDVGLPFSLSSLRVVYERLPLYSEILHPKKNSMLFDFLDEDPDATYLFMDKMLQGKTAVHVVNVHADAQEFADYISIFKSPTMVANTISDLGLVSAIALKSFFKEILE